MSKLPKHKGFNTCKFVSTQRAGLPYSIFFLHFSFFPPTTLICLGLRVFPSSFGATHVPLSFLSSLPSSLQELQKEKNCASVQLDQSTRRLSQLEEEKKTSDQSFKRTQGLLDDLRGNLAGELAQVMCLVCCLVFYLDCLSACQLNQRGRRRS